MEIEHGKNLSYIALIIAFGVILLYVYGDVYALLGAMLGFLGLLFMAAMYFNLYEQYVPLWEKEIEREVAKKVDLSRFKTSGAKQEKDSDDNSEQKTE